MRQIRASGLYSGLPLTNNRGPETVLSFAYNTSVIIYELALTSHHPSTAFTAFDAQRLEYLNACLHATKAVADHFLSINVPSRYRGIHFMFVVQYSHAAQVLYRLSILEDPAWDRGAVRQTADVLDYLARAVARIEVACKELIPGSTQRILFTRGLESLSFAIPIWKAAIEGVNGGGGGGNLSGGPSPSGRGDEEAGLEQRPGQGQDYTKAYDPMLTDLLDERWLTDMFIPWDGQGQ